MTHPAFDLSLLVSALTALDLLHLPDPNTLAFKSSPFKREDDIILDGTDQITQKPKITKVYNAIVSASILNEHGQMSMLTE
jgi:hypothetical protein